MRRVDRQTGLGSGETVATNHPIQKKIINDHPIQKKIIKQVEVVNIPLCLQVWARRLAQERDFRRQVRQLLRKQHWNSKLKKLVWRAAPTVLEALSDHIVFKYWSRSIERCLISDLISTALLQYHFETELGNQISNRMCRWKQKLYSSSECWCHFLLLFTHYIFICFPTRLCGHHFRQHPAAESPGARTISFQKGDAF